MTIEEARENAALAWCSEKNKHKIMDVDLAERFAEILRNLVNEEKTRILQHIMEEIEIISITHS